MEETRLLAVMAIGADRPGIVAGVTKVLYEAGANLEDATSTILRGHFTMMLIVRVPAAVTAEDLEAKLGRVAEELGLVVSARPVDEAQVEVTQPTHMISVYGADRPGIVYRLSEALAERGANVTDFTSRVIGDDAHPVYAVMLEISTDAPDVLRDALERLAESLGVDVSMHAIETDLL